MKILQTIGFWLLVIVELIKMPFSGVDYRHYTIEQRSAYLTENAEVFDSLIDTLLNKPHDEGDPLDSVWMKDDANTKELYKKIKSRVKEEAWIYYDEEGTHITLQFASAPIGFGTCFLHYAVNPEYTIVQQKNLEWDDEVGCYVMYNAANYHEITQVDEHWYIDAEAFYNHSAFRRQEKKEEPSEDAAVTEGISSEDSAVEKQATNQKVTAKPCTDETYQNLKEKYKEAVAAYNETNQLYLSVAARKKSEDIEKSLAQTKELLDRFQAAKQSELSEENAQILADSFDELCVLLNAIRDELQ